MTEHEDDGLPHDWMVQIGDTEPVERRGQTYSEIVDGLVLAASVAGAIVGSGTFQARIMRLDQEVEITVVSP